MDWVDCEHIRKAESEAEDHPEDYMGHAEIELGVPKPVEDTPDQALTSLGALAPLQDNV